MALRFSRWRLIEWLVLLGGIVLLCVLGIVHFAKRSGNSPIDALALVPGRIALGRQLFDDPRLSSDGTIRCASCHIPEQGYADGRRVAIGVGGRAGTRNVPSLMTIEVARETAFFWDGRRMSLEQAVLDPLTNPVEMGLRDQDELLLRIRQNPTYVQEFAQAFPGTAQAITPEHVGVVLASYVRSLRPPESAYDRFLHGDKAALSPRALQGLAIFKGKGECVECHSLENAMFTDHAYHRTGVGIDGIAAKLPELTTGVIQRSLAGGEIGNRVATHADEAQLGRFNVTRNPADIGLFRTPSLRYVAHTAPYMHDGSIATLDAAINNEVYYRSMQAGHPLQLSVEDRENLEAFLEAL